MFTTLEDRDARGVQHQVVSVSICLCSMFIY
jgi:hypothetical protein